MFAFLWCGETNHFRGYGTKQNDHFESISAPGKGHISIRMRGKRPSRNR